VSVLFSCHQDHACPHCANNQEDDFNFLFKDIFTINFILFSFKINITK